MANTTAVSNPRCARKLGHASIGVSLSGIIISVVIAVVVVCIVTRPNRDSCSHSYQGSCYSYKTYVGSSGSCYNGVKSYDGYCYFKCFDYMYHHEVCYKYKTYVSSSSTCKGARSGSYCYSNSCPYHMYLGNCYKYKTYVGDSGSCINGVKSHLTGYCYSTSCAYYHYDGGCYTQ